MRNKVLALTHGFLEPTPCEIRFAMRNGIETGKPYRETLKLSQDSPSNLAAEASTRDSTSIGVLIKAFRVLEWMASAAEPLPLKSIAVATELPKGTLFRILHTLMGLGYVNQMDETGHYFITSQVSHLGRNVQHEDLKMLAMPLMKQVHTQFNETVNLGVLEGGFVYYIAVMEAQRTLSWRVPTGSRDNYFSTALGRAIAAQLPEDRQAALIAQTGFDRRRADTVHTRKELVDILAAAHEAGIALDREENDDGVVCIGVPLFLDARIVAGLSVSVPASRLTVDLEQKIKRALLDLDRTLHSRT